MSDHDDIKARKTMAEIIASFGSLVGMVLLFNHESPYYRLSGIVGHAALDDEAHGGTVLSLHNPRDGSYLGCLVITTRPELEDLLRTCDAFVGKTAEDSFLLAP